MRFRWSRSVPVADGDEWEERLFALGLDNIVINHEPHADMVVMEAYFDGHDSAAAFQAEHEGEVAEYVDQNWMELSQRRARRKTIEIADRFVVTLDDDPHFLDELRISHRERDLLVFPPDLAFGTGDHETTTTCLQLLVEAGKPAPWSFLDLGTGTGILSVAAHRLGAERILATEFDPLAIKVAKKRFHEHGVAAELREEDALDWTPNEKFDVVTANIFHDVLIATMPKIRASTVSDGMVVLSGILDEQLPNVRDAVERSGLKTERLVEAGKWVTILASG
ncbi:MAG: 50S ribosomal protein L11 methyltransferase [Verrucomicrobiota bacterium]